MKTRQTNAQFPIPIGSGNFLTETYLSLRKLENRVLESIIGTQMTMLDAEELIHVTIDQFYGIEINDFAVEVAKTALWIAELQMLEKTREIANTWIDPLPLKTNENIHCGNALRMDWNEVVSSDECDYIIGNPPFIGYSSHTKEQQADRALLFGKVKTVDYVACWYVKAAEYMGNRPIRTAFVSTNSICQGQQVEPIWKPLFEKGFHIDFAHRSFVWNSEALDQAHVHVVIIGFSKTSGEVKRLYDGGSVIVPNNINGYLADAPDVFLSRRSSALCDVLPMVAGGKPSDGTNLIMKSAEMESLIARNPVVSNWIRPFSMGEDFIKGVARYCLWLVDVPMSDIEAIPDVKARVDAVREMRLASTKPATRAKASTPQLFDEVRPPHGNAYLAIPKVSSERRDYIPIGFVTNGMIPGDKLFYISDATTYDFGILMSQFHNAWMRAVAGRLEMRYSYANTIVYNNFVWPDPTSEQRQRIEECAQAVLDARDNHSDLSLAKLYDPDKMPSDLLAAHKALDAAVEAAYGVDFDGDEEKIVAHLFELYAEKTGA